MIWAIKVGGDSSVIHSQPLSITPEFMLIRYFLESPYISSIGSWLSGEPITWLEGWNFQLHSNTHLWGEKGREVLEVESIVNGQWFNQAWLYDEALKSERTGVGEYMEVLGEWHAWRGHGSSELLLTYLALWVSSIRLFLSYILLQ